MVKTKKQIPHTFIILFALVLLSCLLTYIVPAGQYESEVDGITGQSMIIEDSYQCIDQTPVSPLTIFSKFYDALIQPKTAGLMFFILLMGGCFEVIMQTGSMKALCEAVLSRMKGKKVLGVARELWIIPIFVCLFSVFGFTMGLTTASIVFVPIGIAAASTLHIPKMCGMAMVALGTNAGFTAGVFNPFSVGIAQSIAELPLYSGAGYRWITLLVLNLITSIYLMMYAGKYRNDGGDDEIVFPKKSLNIDEKEKKLNHRSSIVLVEFVITFFAITVGIVSFKFSTKEILSAFLIATIVMGLTSGMKTNEVCDTFVAGCKRMVKGVLVIGFAATIRLILSEGNIMDTITYELSNLVLHLPGEIQLIGMFLFNALINFLITSGSAKAALVMPLLVPMSDTLALSRQSAVYAFQMGDGLTNLASPISTTLNGVLAMSEETYEKWIKFYLPLVGIYVITGCVMVFTALKIGY